MDFGVANTSLSVDTPIYRIINFFELYEILSSQRLRISKAAMFEDENEAIEQMLHGLQIIAGPCRGGIGYSWEGSYIDAIRAHNEIKHSAFISSWTITPESVAMWSLYSKDYIGVRIKTTIGKLLNAVKSYQESQSLMNSCQIGTICTSAVGQCYIESVQYVDAKKMFKRVVNRKKAYDKLEVILLRKGIQPYMPGGDFERYNNFLNLPKNPYLVKDQAYSHESEVRAVIRVRRVDHDASSKADILTPEDIIGGKGGIPNSQFEILGTAKESDFDSMVYIEIADDFTEEICVDPRCPSFKKKQMLSILEKFQLPLSESYAFGYLPKPEYFSPQ
ncbi:MAG: hypothetical protein ACJAS1_006275 [Oleiphilaceae bacterium]